MTERKKTGGRIEGTPNKATASIRDKFKTIIQSNLEQIESDLASLKPIERLKVITDLAKFCVPTLKSIDYVDKTIVSKEPVRIIFKKKK
jgi:hypothetical protein